MGSGCIRVAISLIVASATLGLIGRMERQSLTTAPTAVQRWTVFPTQMSARWTERVRVMAKYHFLIEVETDDIIGVKEQISACIEDIAKVRFPCVREVVGDEERICE